ncbi:conserved hypothetical protein [Crenothrix polyspora]|uniref:Addiction module component n=1 Tax=Crenothrix polyspora TaxID=360316 RepID=A0A1R4HBY8_9GAMM|nr:conserved hypothetical protein [Crenothrix polyspora]
MEALWDSLIHEEIEPKSPEWHHNILSARKMKIAEGQAEFISPKELKSKQSR